MREVTWRFIDLSQAKSTWALVRAFTWGDWNSLFKIIYLLNAESSVKTTTKNLTDYWAVKRKNPPASFVEDLSICSCFIYMQLHPYAFFWQWGNQMEIWNISNKAAFKLTDDQWTSCFDNTFFGHHTFFAHTSDWMLFWKKKTRKEEKKKKNPVSKW